METLRNYLDSMFQKYPETEESRRAKQELWQMMEDKYNELLSDGKKENEAVGIVIAEFGDLEEVADSIGLSTMLARVETPKTEEKAAEELHADQKAQQSAGPQLVFEEMGARFKAGAERIWKDAIDGTARDVEEGTAENASGYTSGAETGSSERTGAWWTWDKATAGVDSADSGETIFRVLNGVLSVYWQTVTCIYLCWSFLTFRWWITWIIWPLAGVLHTVLKRLVLGDVTARNGRTYRNRLIAAVLESYWPCVVFVYFAVSFLFHMWPVSWLIFVIAPFFRSVLKKFAMNEEMAA